MSININNHQERMQLTKSRCETEIEFERRIRDRAIEAELEYASDNARSEEYEEAILRLVDEELEKLVDIIETLLEK